MMHLKLCLVTHAEHQPFAQYKKFILQAIAGGVTAVQLREKNLDCASLRARAMALKALLTPLHIPLIINDHVALAKEIDADGVHLGQRDGSPLAARALLGPDKIIGWSVETWDELARANQYDSLDYIGASAVFASTTKLDCKTIWGLDGLARLVHASKHAVIAIGGITKDNIGSVMAAGASGVAVISAIHDHASPQQAAKELVNGMNF